MVNFIDRLSYYAVADKCKYCNKEKNGIWYPKYVFNRCPCCGNKLTRSKQKFNDICRRKDKLSTDEVAAKIEDAISRGWKLINPELFKQVKDYEIMMQKIKLDKKNNG